MAQDNTAGPSGTSESIHSTVIPRSYDFFITIILPQRHDNCFVKSPGRMPMSGMDHLGQGWWDNGHDRILATLYFHHNIVQHIQHWWMKHILMNYAAQVPWFISVASSNHILLPFLQLTILAAVPNVMLQWCFSILWILLHLEQINPNSCTSQIFL